MNAVLKTKMFCMQKYTIRRCSPEVLAYYAFAACCLYLLLFHGLQCELSNYPYAQIGKNTNDN